VNRRMISIRLSAPLNAAITREAKTRGLTRSAWMHFLLERSTAAEVVEKRIEAADRQATSIAPGTISDELLEIRELIAFTAHYTQEMLQALNVALNRSTAEVGRIAATARDRAMAQTKVFLSRRARQR
jgi:predicted acetyltransferase